MQFDAAIKYLDKEIEQEGTRSECGKVLVGARETIARRDASLLNYKWAEILGFDIYDATSDGMAGYGDSDYADSIQSELCEILGIEYEEDEEE